MSELIDSLHLNIIACSCSCGNRWTHSYSWLASQAHGYLGGTPDPLQREKLKHHSFSHEAWNVDGCFRCVPLGLGENWTKPLIESFSSRPQARLGNEPGKNSGLLD